MNNPEIKSLKNELNRLIKKKANHMKKLELIGENNDNNINNKYNNSVYFIGTNNVVLKKLNRQINDLTKQIKELSAKKKNNKKFDMKPPVIKKNELIKKSNKNHIISSPNAFMTNENNQFYYLNRLTNEPEHRRIEIKNQNAPLKERRRPFGFQQTFLSNLYNENLSEYSPQKIIRPTKRSRNDNNNNNNNNTKTKRARNNNNNNNNNNTKTKRARNNNNINNNNNIKKNNTKRIRNNNNNIVPTQIVNS